MRGIPRAQWFPVFVGLLSVSFPLPFLFLLSFPYFLPCVSLLFRLMQNEGLGSLTLFLVDQSRLGGTLDKERHCSRGSRVPSPVTAVAAAWACGCDPTATSLLKAPAPGTAFPKHPRLSCLLGCTASTSRAHFLEPPPCRYVWVLLLLFNFKSTVPLLR